MFEAIYYIYTIYYRSETKRVKNDVSLYFSGMEKYKEIFDKKCSSGGTSGGSGGFSIDSILNSGK